MTCEALINRFLADFIDGSLSTARKADFRLHLALCRACRRYVASYRRTVRLAREAGDAVPGVESVGDVPAELVEAILQLTRGS